eukprot:13574726-Alexandrium_andersonii.AAC.1
MLGGSSGATRADRSFTESSSSDTQSRQTMSLQLLTKMGSGRGWGVQVRVVLSGFGHQVHRHGARHLSYC